MLKKITWLSGLLLTLTTPLTSFGQGQGNAPYSVIGVGEPESRTNVSQDAMGGTGVSFTNGFYINLLNPALVVKSRTIGSNKYVMMNVGIKGRSSMLIQGNNRQQDTGLNLNHIALAFPIKPRWASTVMLQPVSIVDHTARKLANVSGIDAQQVNYDLNYHGSISRIAWGNSFRIHKSLYLGLDAGYDFGTIYRDTTASLVASNTQIRASNRNSYGGYSLKGGIAYQQKVSEKWQLNAGATYELKTKLKGESLRTFQTYSNSSNGPFLTRPADTLSYNNITSTLPSNYRVGVSLESPYKWIFAAEYAVGQWSNFIDTNGKGSPYLRNSNEFNLGVEYLPDYTSTSYFNQVFYRFGYRQGKTPYIIDGTGINDRSFNFGLSLPMGRSNPSYVDFSMAIGRRGVTVNNLVQENYVRFGVNASLQGAWFIKPRID